MRDSQRFRKVSLIVVMAAVIVFAFGSVAFAKYAGYAYNTPVVLSDGTTQDNAMVGYLSWDGAVALMSANGITDIDLLATPHGGYTAATSKCAVCHSTHRAASDQSVSGVGSYWKLTPSGMSCIACHTANGANTVSTALVEWPTVYADGGPHSRQDCLGACHASVHGAGGSVYGTMRAFNLNGDNDAAIAAAFAAGNVWTAEDSLANDPTNGGGRGLMTEETFMDYASSMPTSVKKSTTFRALRAMATGYTCGASGCHASSQFAVNKEGYAELRAGDPANSTDLNTLFTGHLTNMVYGCPPCHMNDLTDPLGRESQCAQCHDMIGKATATTAFPHANRNITVYELDAFAETTEKVVTAGNLWMYAGDATKRGADGSPSATGTASARARWVIENSSHYDDSNGLPGNIVDGACLKCHAYAAGAHAAGGWPSPTTNYLKADGTPTGNILDFSKF